MQARAGARAQALESMLRWWRLPLVQAFNESARNVVNRTGGLCAVMMQELEQEFNKTAEAPQNTTHDAAG